MDRLTPARRSALMARIRGKDTLPELRVRSMLHRLGYRYVLHDARLPGRPDLAFPSRGKVVFVHGCFWHGHRCARGFKPTTNAVYWAAKITANRERDQRQLRELRRLGWKALVVWECALRHPLRLQRWLMEFLDS